MGLSGRFVEGGGWPCYGNCQVGYPSAEFSVIPTKCWGVLGWDSAWGGNFAAHLVTMMGPRKCVIGEAGLEQLPPQMSVKVI